MNDDDRKFYFIWGTCTAGGLLGMVLVFVFYIHHFSDNISIDLLNKRIDDVRMQSSGSIARNSESILELSKALNEAVQILSKQVNGLNVDVAGLNHAVNSLFPDNRPKEKIRTKPEELKPAYKEGNTEILIPPESLPTMDLIIPPAFEESK